MAQNVFYCPDPSLYQVVTSTAPLTDFNPDRIAELVNLQFDVDPIGYYGASANDTVIEVYLPLPVTQQDIDDALAKLNTICADPTRGDLTAEQQAAAALAAERAKLNQKIDDAVADKNSINLAGTGLKDRITGNTNLSILGINDILSNVIFNAAGRTNTQKIEDLRVEMLEMADICKQLLVILANTRQDDAYLMREKKQDLSGN